MIWASRWSVALRTFYRQILSVLYSSFPFGNFRPRLVRVLLVHLYVYTNCHCHSKTLGLENLQNTYQNTEKRQSILQKNYWPCSSFGHVFQQSCALKSYHVTRTERFHGLLQVGWKNLPVKVIVLFRRGGVLFWFEIAI